jgi:hypothetical protein
MAWVLSSAVLRCQARRLCALARSAPLLSSVALVAVVAAPWPLARAGAELGRALGPALDERGLAQGLITGLALAGATAGAALAVSCPGRRGLGPQLAAGPVGSGTALVALALVPAAVALVPVLPSALAFMLPFAAQTPGGPAGGVVLLVAALAGGAAAAVVAEAAVHVSCGRPAALLPAVALVTAWVGVGVALDAPGLGPLALAAAAVAGDRPVGIALAATTLVAAGLVVVWAAMACRRPERRARGRSRTLRLVRGHGPGAVPAAVLALVVRRRDLRLAALAALAFGIGGVVVGAASAAQPPAPLLLGATSTLLGAALAPLALPGALVTGRWAWACAPRRLLPAVAGSLVGPALLLAALVPVVLGAQIVSAVTATTLARLAVLAVITAAAALLAGVLVPWRGEGIGDQLASFGAFAVCGAVVSGGTGLAGPQLVAAGLPAGVAAAALGCVALTVAACALGCGIHRAA